MIFRRYYNWRSVNKLVCTEKRRYATSHIASVINQSNFEIEPYFSRLTGVQCKFIDDTKKIKGCFILFKKVKPENSKAS